jgi:hypothetical protein
MDAYESPKLVIFNFFFVLKKEEMDIKGVFESKKITSGSGQIYYSARCMFSTHSTATNVQST